MTTSFGKYFDDQRDRIVKDMQNNKNTELYNAWREDFDKRQMDKKEKIKATYVDDNTPREELDIVKKHIQEENRLMTLNPLGHRPIKDIDEIHSRNRRKTDDPCIRAISTTRSEDYKRWKNNPAERR